MAKRALITGVLGQDGSYLANLLVTMGYEVIGVDCVTTDEFSSIHPSYWPELLSTIIYIKNNLSSLAEIERIVEESAPTFVAHFAASSFVSFAPSEENNILQNNIFSTHALLTSTKTYAPQATFVFAASSEIFGRTTASPQDENSPMRPSSIYGVSKHTGFDLVRYYREQHGLRAGSTIFFNHESPRRGMRFVTRKVSSTVARIKLGREKKLVVGNLEASRDWGYAPDYVKAVAAMADLQNLEDFVLATGKLHTVRDLVATAFAAADLDWLEFTETSGEFCKPSDNIALVGNAARATEYLGFCHSKDFVEVVKEMVAHDIELLQNH